MNHRACPECGAPIHGRIDKKFCSDQCRFLFNNRKKRDSEVTISNVNQTLRRNRSILRGYNPIGKTTIRKQHLIAQGFDFHFYTHTFRTKAGLVYYFCYEYGYSFVEEDKVVLVTWQAYMNQHIDQVLYKKRFDAL